MHKISESFHLVTDAVATRAADVIKRLPHDGSIDVFIRTHKEDRSLKQNRLMWMWNGEFGASYGITKEESHAQFKWRFCRPILIRDDDDGTLKALFDRADSPELARRFIDLISTRDMSMSQLAEALTEYDRWCGYNGIILTHPDDIYFEAIGEAA